ncbi:MAG: hypothetical protein GAK37_03162 [Pseudomonas sp.]|nr:MAG: hypothetical protein GAK37_03162 [Pseudomonas sp.]
MNGSDTYVNYEINIQVWDWDDEKGEEVATPVTLSGRYQLDDSADDSYLINLEDERATFTGTDTDARDILPGGFYNTTHRVLLDEIRSGRRKFDCVPEAAKHQAEIEAIAELVAESADLVAAQAACKAVMQTLVERNSDRENPVSRAANELNWLVEQQLKSEGRGKFLGDHSYNYFCSVMN